MEDVFFVINGSISLKLMSWNINGIRNKFESKDTLEVILKHDIVFLNEIKCSFKFDVPGFKLFVSKLDSKSPNRGGTAMLVKHWLVQYLDKVDCSCIDQI